MIAVPFREKPVSGRGETSSLYVPWTRTELKIHPEDFPNILWNPDSFIKYFNC